MSRVNKLWPDYLIDWPHILTTLWSPCPVSTDYRSRNWSRWLFDLFDMYTKSHFFYTFSTADPCGTTV